MKLLLLYVIAIYLLFFLWRYIYIIYSYWITPFERIVYSLQDGLPEELVHLFAAPQQQLVDWGFTDPIPMFVTDITGLQKWSILMRHEAGKAFVILELKTTADVIVPFSITFHSITTTNDFVETFNGQKHLIMGDLPRTIVQDAYTPEFLGQWQLHQNAVASAPGEAVQMQTLDFLDRLQQHYDEYFQYLIDTKRLGEEQDSLLRYPTIAAAWQMARSYGQGSKKVMKLRKQLLANTRSGKTPAFDVPITLEAHSFTVLRDLQTRIMNRQWKLWAVLITLGLFLISFSQLMEFRFVLILLGVLFLHEGGHWLAMSLTGYKDMSLFFIPFLGAAVTGKKQQEVVGERMLVLLAGPLPGLILGVGMRWGLMGTAVPTWVRELSSMLIIINILNLLPLYPLDGGQIINMLLFSRRPYADVLFKLLAVIAFGAAAFWLKDPILTLLAVIVAATIRSGFRFARVFKYIDYSEINDEAENGRIRASFQAINDAGYNQLSFAHKFQLVKGLMSRSRHVLAGRKQRLLLTAIYAIILSGGLVLSALALFPGGR